MIPSNKDSINSNNDQQVNNIYIYIYIYKIVIYIFAFNNII